MTSVKMKMLSSPAKLILACILLLFMQFPLLWAQPDSLLPGYGRKNFKIATTQPQFEGGVQGLYNWLSTRIDLKELEAGMKETEMEPRRLMIRFWVQVDGSSLNYEILPLNGYQDHPVANTLLKALKDMPDFVEPAVDAYDNPTVYNYVIPVWVHGNRVKVGYSKYAIDELEDRKGRWYFGSYPFTGKAMRYHSNGKKQAEQNYKAGLLEGKAIYWDENEVELYREGYQEGELIVCLDGESGTCRMRCEGGTPRFLPGLDSLELLRSENLEYPLHRCGTGGRVEVMIQVDREGKIATARVIDAGPQGYARHAMEFLYSLPARWEPCTVEGKPVETRIVFPVEFDPYVNREDSLKYIGGIAHFERKPFTGWMFSPGPQLQPLQKGRFEEGKKEGLWQSWDVQNRPIAHLNYHQNQLDGSAMQWDTLGRKLIEEWWEDGIRTDLTKWEYGADTVPISEKHITSTGLGTWMGWYTDGAQRFSGDLLDGQRAALWKWWHPNGAPQSEVIYLAGILMGEQVYWDPNGKKLGKIEYKEGKPFQGKQFEWWENGQMKTASRWKKGQKHGQWKTWTQEGKLEVTKWKKGKQAGGE